MDNEDEFRVVFKDLLELAFEKQNFAFVGYHENAIGDAMASPELSLGSPCGDGEEEELEEAGGCKLCMKKYDQPRVLSCLHVYCEECLKEHFWKQENDNAQGCLTCPDCGQGTKLGAKGVSGLPLDYITSNKLDMEAIENMQIVCTSCKAKEKAVARCTECATFLCNNCVTAHQYMRCFENHKVVSFDDMKGAGDGFSIHKPVTCLTHPEEQMKFFCHTCHIPICHECILIDHKQPEHHYEKAVDVEVKQKEELGNLVMESRSKVKLCEDASSTLSTYLSELQLQRDNAKSHIEETFQTYKALLEKHQELLLQELENIHLNQELQVMDTFHNVEKAMEKIEDACKFAEKLLDHGNTLEILSLKYVVGSQLLSLINNTPKLEIVASVSFDTDEKKFEAAIKENFGKVVKPEAVVAVKSDSPHSPAHSTSSFDSDRFNLPTGVVTPESSQTSLDIGSAPEFIRENISAMGNSSYPIADLLATGEDRNSLAFESQMNALKNLTALARMGTMIYEHRDMMNGIEVGSVTGFSPEHSETMRALSTPSPIDSFSNMMSNNSIVASPRGQSPLDDVILDGSSIMSHGLPSPSILPPSALSPMSGSAFDTIGHSVVKLSTMQIRCKFGQLGPGKCQFSSPHGFCLGIEEEIVVADTNNHRIQVFEKTGDFRYQFGLAGKEEGQLWYPRKVAVIRSSGKFVVCDGGSERSRMQIFTKTGHFLKKIAIRYIDIVAGLAITSEGNIVAVDSVAPTVFIISEAGDLLHWFDCSEHMREPSDIAVCGKEFFVCDFKGHCVIVFSDEGVFLRKIGNDNVTNFPNGIDISDAGDVLVGDSHGNRFHIVVFSRQGRLLSEFECPYVKVSRCCGLKITSEGYVVTLAKNNHHVLVLNTLYIV